MTSVCMPTPVRTGPPEHFEHVLRRLREQMAERELDALIAFGPENLYYASGWASSSAYRHGGTGFAAVTVFRDASLVPVLVDAEYWGPSARTGPHLELITYPTWIFIDNLHDYPGVHLANEHPPEASLDTALSCVLDAVRERIGDATVGVDVGHLRAHAWTYLRDNSHPLELVDATHAFEEARVIKSSWEIEQLVTAHEITQNGVTACLTNVREGATSAELHRQFTLECLSDPRCSDVRFALINIGTDFSPLYFPQREIPARSGDLVKFDLGAEVAGYGSDIARVVAIGEPNPDARKIHDALLAGNQTLVDGAVPGRPLADMFTETISVIRANGIPRYDRGHVGHSIGLARAVEEAPQVSSASSWSLQPGMVLSLETPYYGYGVGAMNIEDTIVVRDDGVEVLTSLSKKLTSS